VCLLLAFGAPVQQWVPARRKLTQILSIFAMGVYLNRQ
jgi:hypothetical protein